MNKLNVNIIMLRVDIIYMYLIIKDWNIAIIEFENIIVPVESNSLFAFWNTEYIAMKP